MVAGAHHDGTGNWDDIRSLVCLRRRVGVEKPPHARHYATGYSAQDVYPRRATQRRVLPVQRSADVTGGVRAYNMSHFEYFVHARRIPQNDGRGLAFTMPLPIGSLDKQGACLCAVAYRGSMCRLRFR